MPAATYFDAWLRRTRKQLTASGRLTQVAAVLAAQDGLTASEWEQSLRSILNGETAPGLDILTRIDAVLAGTPQASTCDAQPPEQLDFL